MTYLYAWTNPRRTNNSAGAGADGTGMEGAGAEGTAGTAATGGGAGTTPYPTRLGQAFCSLLEHLDPARMPKHGGTATSVVVTMDFETLKSALGTATTDTGLVISASEARRLACTGHVIPAVLGGEVRGPRPGPRPTPRPRLRSGGPWYPRWALPRRTVCDSRGVVRGGLARGVTDRYLILLHRRAERHSQGSSADGDCCTPRCRRTVDVRASARVGGLPLGVAARS